MEIECRPAQELEIAEMWLDNDMPRGLIDLPEIPALGDVIIWPSGRPFRVIQRTWKPGRDTPLLTLTAQPQRD